MTWTGRGVPCQRWLGGDSTFVPGTLTGAEGAYDLRCDIHDLRAYEVALIPGDKEARAFVEMHHYSRSYPAARIRVGLYYRGRLVGVAVFSHPPSEKVLARLPCERMAGVELGRLVLLDGVPGNAESWFLARCFVLLREAGIEALISHSDPVPRSALDGQVILPGHVGVVYQSTNAVYCGRTKRSLLALLPDGTVFSARSMSKIRGRERGYRYCIEQLVSAGAAPPASDLMPQEELTAWMWQAIGAVCRRVEHGGNHRYVWSMTRALRRAVAEMATGQPYPKQLDALVVRPAAPPLLLAA